MTPDDFLADQDGHFSWQAPSNAPSGLGLTPIAGFTGRGAHPLEVALATTNRRPRADEVRRVWTSRHGHAPNPLLLVASYQDNGSWKASICGPAGDEPPVEAGLELSEVERIAGAALAEPTRHAAIRFLSAIWAELETELPGLRNQGMFATHDLRDGVPTRSDWSSACAKGRPLLSYQGRDLVEQLGFTVGTHATSASVLSIAGTKRAIAIFLDEGEEFEAAADRFGAASPVSHALALADRENLPWVVVTRARQIRVYSARPDVGVGRKGRSETFVEANLALLPDDRAGYVPLLFSAEALEAKGTFEEVLEGSRDYAADLGARLRERVYNEAVPTVSLALARRHDDELDDEALAQVYEQALTVLFRILFVAYAEDKDLLPYRSNGAYREHALKTQARDLVDRRAVEPLVFDANATDLWDDVAALWLAVDKGNVEWGVPPYNGGLFSTDPDVSKAGDALKHARLSNEEFGPVLAAMLVDEGDGAVIGPVDFRSLSVREFGTIYEGLLESSLSVAPSDLAVAPDGTYVPAKGGAEVIVEQGAVYFHNRSGARKATGSYFTKPFAVEHLLDRALESALDDHLARLDELLDRDERAKAADAFFDFRCIDLAMGSGHFLVAAIDRIEARLSAFLALHAIPNVTAELDLLHAAALKALGPLADSVEIEQASLLRRQIARRCVYGVDGNSIAVELARLGIWIHTFVPGLPLSFLDHSLVCGDSLTGIGTLDEAIGALDPEHIPGQASLFRDQILEVLGRAADALGRLARISESSKVEVDEARGAQAAAQTATRPARMLFDLVVAARLGEAQALHSFDEEALAQNSDLPKAEQLRKTLKALHFPIAFPEVFLRERPGFDCILGNPPWEEVMVDETTFWSLRFPGFRGKTPARQRQAIGEFRARRPDLVVDYDRESAEMDQLRRVLTAGPYPGINEGNADLYKAFCWRFWQLTRERGLVGVVLPRSALAAKGSSEWRQTVLRDGEFDDVTMLLNSANWVFDDADPRYTIALAAFRKGSVSSPRVRLQGPYASWTAFIAGRERAPADLDANAFAEWSDGASFPLLPTDDSVPVFLKLRAHPRFDVREGWYTRPIQGDFNATTHRDQFIFDRSDDDALWPVYKGSSFEHWVPDTGEYFARADPRQMRTVLEERRRRSSMRAGSPYSEFSREWLDDPKTLPCEHARIAFRDVTNRTNTRTVIAALVPPRVVITNSAPFLVWPEGSERDQAFLLGVLCSLPLDWYARRFVELHVNFHILNGFPIPRPERDDPLRVRVESIAGRLAAVDERFAEWADASGVDVGGVRDDTEKADLVAELDAAVALLYGLDESDLAVIFDTFHAGWDYAARLEAVLGHLRRLG